MHKTAKQYYRLGAYMTDNSPLQPPENKLMELIDTDELKRGVSLMMDHLNLATPPVMVHTVRME